MPNTMSRRGLLASLPALAATATPAAATALTDLPPQSSAIPAWDASPAAQLARAEHVVNLLRKYEVRDRRFGDGLTWHPGWLDNELTDRMLKYFRDRVVRDYPDDGVDDGFDDVAEFCHAHHVSLDWLITGNIDMLLAYSASCCPAAFASYDA